MQDRRRPLSKEQSEFLDMLKQHVADCNAKRTGEIIIHKVWKLKMKKPVKKTTFWSHGLMSIDVSELMDLTQEASTISTKKAGVSPGFF